MHGTPIKQYAILARRSVVSRRRADGGNGVGFATLMRAFVIRAAHD